jgi:hypothetical protein
MAVKERPDLIISDVMMPKISGFDMLDILRSTPETKDVKVIMMTALSSEDQRARGESLGANRYLVKSQVGIEDVVRTVHDVLSDSPVTTTPNTQLFSTVASSAGNNPAQPIAPRSFNMPPARPDATVTTAPAQRPVMTAPVFQPVQAPQRPQAPLTATPAPVSTPNPTPAPTPLATIPIYETPKMPQPTAPFSTPSPASFEVDHAAGLQSQTTTAPSDISARIAQELNSNTPDSVSTPQI